jgi:hypothetical protein
MLASDFASVVAPVEAGARALKYILFMRFLRPRGFLLCYFNELSNIAASILFMHPRQRKEARAAKKNRVALLRLA